MKEIKDDGGSAFPTSNDVYGGMSLRDWFAGQALAGILVEDRLPLGKVITLAYEIADDMIAERNNWVDK